MANFYRHVQNGSKLPLPVVMATRKKNPACDQQCGKHAKRWKRAGIPSPTRVGAIPVHENCMTYPRVPCRLDIYMITNLSVIASGPFRETTPCAAFLRDYRPRGCQPLCHFKCHNTFDNDASMKPHRHRYVHSLPCEGPSCRSIDSSGFPECRDRFLRCSDDEGCPGSYLLRVHRRDWTDGEIRGQAPTVDSSIGWGHGP